jgi:hypothetical protein
MGKQLLTPEEKRKIRAECCFVSLNTLYKKLLKNKNDYPNFKTILHYMEREYYTAIFDSPAIQTGLYTDYADVTKDHYMSPQICSNFIFDYADIMLNNFEKFFNIFELNCRTILTNKKVNMIIRESKKNNKYTSEESYEKSGIKLYYMGEEVLDHKKALAIPKAVTRWEKGFKVNNFELTVNQNFKVPLSHKIGVLPI